MTSPNIRVPISASTWGTSSNALCNVFPAAEVPVVSRSQVAVYMFRLPHGGVMDRQEDHVWRALDTLIRMHEPRDDDTDLSFKNAARFHSASWKTELQTCSEIMRFVLRDNHRKTAVRSAKVPGPEVTETGHLQIDVVNLFKLMQDASKASGGDGLNNVRIAAGSRSVQEILSYFQPWHMAVVALLYSQESDAHEDCWSFRVEQPSTRAGSAKIIVTDRLGARADPAAQRPTDRRHRLTCWTRTQLS